MTSRAATSYPGPEWLDTGGELVWRTAFGAWQVEARLPVDGGSCLGLTELTVGLVDGASKEAVRETDGLPAGLLRQIPLAEIKAQARAVLAQRAGQELTGPWPVPSRCRTDIDYALLVAELAHTRASGTTAPQQELADRLRISKAAMSTRIKRATDLGLWDGNQLTPGAVALLVEWKNEQKE
ncbi:MarR family transcriptional regulator [Kitasatospora sp. NPDC089913]|uniref:MarR family transcriptional regulator n=1 Tax=Kitasatospora sp. NPDC089913 TaxID=3364080 RepID=UPI00380CDEDC